MKTTESSETCDAILGGKLSVLQPREGYRFSVDSILLARFVSVRRTDRVLELGAGCGVISLVLATLFHPREVVAAEIQPHLVKLIERSVTLNQLESIRAIATDLRTMAADSFDVVVANPPYRAAGTGRISPNDARHIARAETAATLEDFVAAAARSIRRAGKAAFVFAADRSAELISTVREHRLEPKRIRFVHPFANAPAANILLEARKHGGIEVAIEPPLVLFDQPGVYSRAAREILDPVASLGGTQ